MAGYGYLYTTAKTIRRNRTLDQQRALARQGENPATGGWWPAWKEWTHMTDPVRSIMARWSGERARHWGRIGGQSRSLAKAQAARRNGRRNRAR